MMPLRRPTPNVLGRNVLGPIVAEFCLRMHLLTSLTEEQRPGDGILLFCARGGLRMQLAWERFLAATELDAAMPAAPLMVSRLAAIRPALARTITEDLPGLVPSVERTVAYEFARDDLASTVQALSGVVPDGDQSALTTPDGLAALLKAPEGAAAAAAVVEQAELFTRHFDDMRAGHSLPVIVDTGLYGTTKAVLADAYPDLDVRSLLLARTLRPDLVEQQKGTFGLSVEAEVYSTFQRRTALLRHWHYVEWLFEPDLKSVRTFSTTPDGVRSNLEVDGWRDKLEPETGTSFAGVLEYLDGLHADDVVGIPAAAARAWTSLRRAITRPTRAVGHALEIGTRSHDFGREGTWDARGWQGPLDALRSQTMWREGEIARSGGAWRVPLQTAIELAYTVRSARRALTYRRRFGG